MHLAAAHVLGVHVKNPALKERFEQFMSILKGAENIDGLMKQCVLPGRQRADYLAFDRRVIIEQKSLDVNPDYKIQKFIDDLMKTRGIIGYGRVSLDQILLQLPDGQNLKKQLYQKLTQGIDDILAKADKQTRDTRTTFLLPYAIGVVVILNDGAQVIGPDFVCVKAFDMLRLRLPTGEIRYPQNQVVILISEAHRVLVDHPAEVIPIETIFSDSGNQLPIATHYTDMLKQRWAEFNKASYIESSNQTRDVRTREPMKPFNAPSPKSLG
jgi:hypothetical protein